jgi:hypothetical protein
MHTTHAHGQNQAKCNTKALPAVSAATPNCKLQQRRGGVAARRQHKDEGGGGGGVGVARVQVTGRRLHEAPPQVALHKLLHRWHHLVRPEAPDSGGGAVVAGAHNDKVCVRHEQNSNLAWQHLTYATSHTHPGARACCSPCAQPLLQVFGSCYAAAAAEFACMHACMRMSHTV